MSRETHTEMEREREGKGRTGSGSGGEQHRASDANVSWDQVQNVRIGCIEAVMRLRVGN